MVLTISVIKLFTTSLLKRQNPADEVIDFGLVLGLDDLVLFFRAIFKLDFRACGDVLDQLGFGVGLAFIFLCNLLVRRPLFRFIYGVALEAFTFLGQSLRRCRIDGCSSNWRSEDQGRPSYLYRMQYDNMNVLFRIILDNGKIAEVNGTPEVK